MQGTMAEPRGQALLTCDAVARDPAGKVTLYGIFDRIFASKFPTVHPNFSIYWRCVMPAPGRVGVVITRPDGSMVELEPVESNKESEHTMQGTHTLVSFEFPVPGQYTAALLYNGKELLGTPCSSSREPRP